MRTATPPRRAGVRFDAPEAPRADDLPRMDVAALVGYAASGPLHVAVAVEDPAAFDELFGRDLPLGVGADGQVIVAQLPAAVRAFFANGGRRCHVVRVALDDGPDRASLGRLPLHGLVALGDDGAPSLHTVTVDARSEGSWSDGAVVAASLEAEALSTAATADFVSRDDEGRPWLQLAAPQTLAPGDLVRFSVPDVAGDDAAPRDVVGWCFVDAARPIAATDRTEWRRAPGVWFTARPAPGGPAARFTRAAWREGAVDRDVALFAPSAAAPTVALHGDAALVESIDPLVASLRPGALLELRDAPAAARWWLFVDDLRPVAWTLAGDLFARDRSPLAATDATEARWADGASPGLDVRVALSAPVAGTPDGFAWSCVDRRVADVPPGAVLLLYRDGAFRASLRVRALRPSRWSVRGDVRAAMPLPATAGVGAWRIDRVTLALRTRVDGREARVGGLGLHPAHPRCWAALPSDRALFSPHPPWRENPHEALWGDVRRPRLAVAAPADAPARCLPIGLSFARDVTRPAWPPPGASVVRDGLTAPLPTADARAFSPAPFLDARLTPAPAPTLLDAADRLRDESLQALTPEPVRGLHAVLGLAEVTLLAAPDVVWAGRSLRPPAPPLAPSVDLPPRPEDDPPEVGRFRDCGARPPPPPPAALPLPRVAEPREGWRFDPWPADESSATVAEQAVALQRQAIRLCAVRGDLTVALAAPAELRGRGALRHAAALREADGSRDGIDLAATLWTRALSFATLYHPWVVARDGAAAPPRAQSPDGACLGLLARRALTRGAWVSAAYTPCEGALALEPALDDGEVDALLAARVSAFARVPRGVVALDALTLSDDPEYEQLSVRRLMILLRRAALARGERYVFEPLGGALRRAAALGFDALLGGLFDRGAFAGATRGESYRVAVLEGPGDDARLVVELRVAPSEPLRFLTVRLLQRDDALAATEERGPDA